MTRETPREHSSDPVEGSPEEVVPAPATPTHDTGYDEGTGDRLSPDMPSEPDEPAPASSTRHLPEDLPPDGGR